MSFFFNVIGAFITILCKEKSMTQKMLAEQTWVCIVFALLFAGIRKRQLTDLFVSVKKQAECIP